MNDSSPSQWLLWGRELHAIGQTGLYYSQNEFDRIRYQRVAEIAGSIISSLGSLPLEPLKIALNAQPGYVTPKVDVRGAIFHEDQILMVKEWSDGKWSLPGGYADVNEAPSRMVEREVWEESGLVVKAAKLVGVYESNHDRQPVEVFHAYKLLFLCDWIEGSLTPSIETPEVRFFSLDALPEFSPCRTRLDHIQEAYAHLKDPNRPAVFD